MVLKIILKQYGLKDTYSNLDKDNMENNIMKKKYQKPDVDIVEELTKKLFIANKNLENEKKQKNEIISNISHDLRAPLTTIRSSVDYLNQSYDTISSDELKNTLNIMDGRLSVLETLVNDLFYLISINSKRGHFKYESINLTPLIEEYYYTLLSDDSYCNRNLSLDCDSDAILTVNADVKRILRVLDNLTTNAKKYSHDNDSITIGIKDGLLTPLCEDNEVLVYVKDTGIGIAKNYIDKIFERSYTVSRARTPDSSSGSGLGLAIVKEIITKHNGRVWCESIPKKGSTFYFTLKKAAASDPSDKR